MKEIEIKILDINREKITEKLLAFGAEKVFEGEMDSVVFDYPDKRIQNAHQLLRIRTKGDKNILTFKQVESTEGAKICEELEIDVSDFEATKKIFESIGLVVSGDIKKGSIKKYRVSYKLDDVLFEFDNYLGQYDYVPEFLEIEGPSVEKVLAMAEKIGFKKEDCLSWSGWDVFKYYKKD